MYFELKHFYEAKKNQTIFEGTKTTMKTTLDCTFKILRKSLEAENNFKTLGFNIKYNKESIISILFKNGNMLLQFRKDYF